MNPFLIFFIGLTSGGLACLAVQGGLLASFIANLQQTEEKTKQSYPILLVIGLFLISKLIIHTIFGGLLGTVGSEVSISLEIRLFFQFLTAVFLFSTAMNLLQVHPIFRFVQFQPPAFLRRLIFKSARSKTFFAPIVLGLFTLFIPCGVTQSMEILALNSGSVWLGASTMFFFVLGTIPLFATIGIATSAMSEVWHQRFLNLASVALIFMAVSSFNGILTVVDFPITGEKVWNSITSVGKPPEWWNKSSDLKNTQAVRLENGVQKVTIEIQDNGYAPRAFTVKKDVPVELTLNSNNVYSCASSFTFKKFGIYTQLESTDNKTFTFTPTEKGSFTFACSMGMYQGVMRVE
ncbi:MAG: putative membrane protein [Microgenomates group bacterium GW2011_GWF2_45_18]|nr:MAG: putative membrane protein [Microgenomates group bacterium GW2011_GWF2_45_18]OGJ41726.1 MAG: hypothetical protein A2378_02535 [Candidatus Pacebacteria bacterium RIFOXYB1_FULL_44_10]